MPEAVIKVRITSSERNNSGIFSSDSEFIDLEDNLRKLMALALKS